MNPLGFRVTGVANSTLRNRRRDTPTVRTPFNTTGQLFTVAADVLAFMMGIGSPFVLKVGGDLPVGNIILITILPVLLVTKGYRALRPRLMIIILLLAVWFFGQAVTDVYRQTATQDWMRVDARMVFIAIDLLGLAILISRNTRRQVALIIGLALGSALQARFLPSEATQAAPWKFGYAIPTTIAVVLLSCYFYKRQRYTMVVFLLLSVSAVHAALNFRSPILFLFITVVLITPIIPERIGRVRLLPASHGKRTLLQISMAVIAAQAAGSLILFLGANGYLGEAARVKNQRQAQARGGMLLGGRSEILVSSRAVMDSPVLGHGSWAKDPRYVEMYNDLRYEYGVTEDENIGNDEGDLIPTHSHIMSAWVDAGIVGPVFWAYIFFLVLRALIRLAATRTALTPIYAYLLIGFMWGIFFSPPGGITILPECFLMVLSCDILEPASESVSNVGKLRQSFRRSAPFGRSMQVRPF